jgi:hypothetical protein
MGRVSRGSAARKDGSEGELLGRAQSLICSFWALQKRSGKGLSMARALTGEEVASEKCPRALPDSRSQYEILLDSKEN